MKIFLSTALLSLAIALGATTMARAQRTIADCEKIQAADAYNQCLAKFGPPAKTLNVEAARPGDIKGGAEDAAKGAGASRGKAAVSGRRHGRRGFSRRGRGGGHVGRVSRSRHGGGGRKRMTIKVK